MQTSTESDHGMWRTAYGASALAVLCLLASSIGSLWLAPALAEREREQRLAEGREGLEKLREHVVQRCVNERPEGDGQVWPHTVGWPASTPVVPITSCCDPQFDTDGDGRCDQTAHMWDREAWKALGFSIDEPSRFLYSYERLDTPQGQTWRITATADLFCDGELTTLQVLGPDPTRGEVDEHCPGLRPIFFDENYPSSSNWKSHGPNEN